MPDNMRGGGGLEEIFPTSYQNNEEANILVADLIKNTNRVARLLRECRKLLLIISSRAIVRECSSRVSYARAAREEEEDLTILRGGRGLGEASGSGGATLGIIVASWQITPPIALRVGE
ncbi:PREDICTED: uncharacterized protein LOC105455104 [Wasmannia auropunctata]|uniref:uncharacterized protein LOC105455104 n=1 Tax=Wasmannia auropunctata TaxID=64793 RepID=UPI0005EFC013|nr:PREDICTED: uncharacterized protein LOC105455104 [Wasmannia auropunctata]